MPAFDVAIVGLGAMGSAAAWHLASRGLRVLGLDRHTPPHHFGSTHGHTRIIREAYYEHPQYVPMVQRASTLWDRLSESAHVELMIRTGGLMIGPRSGRLVTGALLSARLHNLPCALWSAADLRRRVPALRPDDSMVGLWEPRAGILLPERCVSAMLALARRCGAELVYNTPVTGWVPDGDGVRIATASQDYRASRLVLAGGAWMGQLLPTLGLPLTVERAVQFWFRPADPPIAAPDRLPVFIVQHSGDQLFYGLPDTGHGVKVARHHQGDITTPETVRRLVDDQERRVMHALVARWMPAVAGPLTDATVCLYTNTPDEHFVIDRHPQHPQVVIASPCSGHGFKFASAIGEILADLATGVRSALDLGPFALTRFAAH